MKIVVTESLFKNLLKTIIKEQEQELDEKLGVPDNIYETAVFLYDQLVRTLPLNDSQYIPSENRYKVTIKNKFTVGEYTFSTVNFSIEYDLTYNVPHIILSRTAVSNPQKVSGGKMIHAKLPELRIIIEFLIKEHMDKREGFTYIINHKNEIINNLAHELKHGYDHYMKTGTDMKTIADYMSYNEMQNIPPIDRFIRNLYFTHEIESSVRPTEIYTSMKLDDVDQEGFKRFIYRHPIYQELKDISIWDVNQMKEGLKNHIPQITNILQQAQNPAANGTDDEKINQILRLAYIQMGNIKGKHLSDRLVSNPIEMLLGLPEDKNKIYKSYMADVARFENNPIGFYEYEGKKMRDAAKKVVRKLHKLYGMAKEKESGDDRFLNLNKKISNKLK